MRLTWRPKLASAHPGVDCLWILPSVRSQSREGVDGVEPLEVTIAPSGIASNDTLAACYILAGFPLFSTRGTSLGRKSISEYQYTYHGFGIYASFFLTFEARCEPSLLLFQSAS